MSEIKYGLISRTDAKTLEKTLDLIMEQFPGEVINICEVGIYAGETGNGLREYVKSKGREVFLTGIDDSRNGESVRFVPDKWVWGNSAEVAHRVPDNSQHLVFIDACHALPYVVADHVMYSPKVKTDAFLAFHDTAQHIPEKTQYQGVGSKDDPAMYISVREALRRLGMIGGFPCNIYPNSEYGQWLIKFDEADISDAAGGICVFKKLM